MEMNLVTGNGPHVSVETDVRPLVGEWVELATFGPGGLGATETLLLLPVEARIVAAALVAAADELGQAQRVDVGRAAKAVREFLPAADPSAMYNEQDGEQVAFDGLIDVEQLARKVFAASGVEVS